MSSYQQMTAARRNGNQPKRLQCTICKVHKNIEFFSKNEMKKASYGSGPPKIRCSQCSTTQRQELECEMCGDTKDIDAFSKSSRKAGGNKWCKECTIYKEAALPDSEQGVTVSQAEWESGGDYPNMPTSEKPSSTLMGRSSDAHGFAGNATGSGDNYDPAFGMEALKLNKHQNPSVSSRSAVGGYVPPHLRKAVSAAAQNDNTSVSSASNIYEDAQSSAATETDGGWEQVDNRRKPYNAWGPNGEHQVRYSSNSSAARTPASSSTTPPLASTSDSTANSGLGSGNWAKPVALKPVAPLALRAPEKTEHNNRYDLDSSDDDEAY